VNEHHFISKTEGKGAEKRFIIEAKKRRKSCPQKPSKVSHFRGKMLPEIRCFGVDFRSK